MSREGLPGGPADEVDGMMDFVYFCSAVRAMTMERNAQLFKFFQTSSDPQTVKLRQTLVQLYGKGWTKRVFGFEA